MVQVPPEPPELPASSALDDRRVVLLHHRARWSRWAGRLAYLMDEALPIPLTKHRIGVDALLGFFVPGAGDAASALSGVLLIVFAFMMRVPGIVMIRMALNIVIDSVTGMVPIAGDIFDVGFKSNRRNVRLIERFQRPGATARRSDYFFVGASVLIALAALVIPLVAAAWIISRLLRR